MRVLVAVLILAGLAAPVRAESKKVCKRECRDGIASCAAWRPEMKPRKAKRLCAKEMLPICRIDGTKECTRAPHYLGSYVFDATFLATTCATLPDDYPPLSEPIAIGVVVHDRAREELDATLYWNGTTEASGRGGTLPWTLYGTGGDCLYSPVVVDPWCADGPLTIYGLPPRIASAPPVPASLTVELTHRTLPACTVTYTGSLRYGVRVTTSIAGAR
jgi:hypothetical protein